MARCALSCGRSASPGKRLCASCASKLGSRARDHYDSRRRLDSLESYDGKSSPRYKQRFKYKKPKPGGPSRWTT